MSRTGETNRTGATKDTGGTREINASAGPRLSLAAWPVLRRRLQIVIFAVTVCMLGGIVGWRITTLRSWREKTLKATRSQAASLAFILSEYLHETFGATDAALRQLVIQSRRVSGPTAPGEDWDPILQSTKAALIGSGSISILDASGKVRHSTLRAIVGESRRGQYLFKRLSASGGDELVIDAPFLSRFPRPGGGPRPYVIPLGRRLTGETGRFEGAVVATLVPDELGGLIRSVDVGREGIIWVFHPNGIIMFREPSTQTAMGESAAENPIFQAASRAGAPGAIEGPIVPGGAAYVSAFQPLATAPLTVAVSLSQSEALADWYRQRRSSGTAFVVVAAVMVAMLMVLSRQINEKASAERALDEAKRLEAIKLREANDRLAQALTSEQHARRESEAAGRVKDQFLMTVSHELRTPLTAIFGWARMLAAGTLREDQQQRALAIIERNARTQARLIDDLLDVSRIISGKLRIDPRPIVLADVLQAAIDSVRPAVEAKGILLDTMIEPGMDPITGDPDRLQQILWNLLSNAIKFTPAGGRALVRMARADDHVEISVTDSGVGIELEFLPHVFERFWQQDAGTRRRYGGLGLGLAIVRHLVELHGGTVAVESAGAGQGATFLVRLPAPVQALGTGEPVENAQALQAAPGGPSGAAGRLDGVRVLVVDDEPEARDLFESILEEVGATVVTAASSRDALAILRESGQLERGNHPGNPRPVINVLLSDIEMPEEDGYEFVQKALALARGRGEHLAAVAVTAHGRSTDRLRAFEAGFTRHLAKPVDPAELVSVVASVTEHALQDCRIAGLQN